MAKKYKITSSMLKELEDELIYLKTIREKEVAEQIKEARSFGDLSENSEYDEAKNEQAKLYGRIAEIEDILQHAEVIEENDQKAGIVSLGCTIRVKDAETGDIEIYAIVGSQEADPGMSRISDDSPFGKACLGKTIGDTFEFEAPAGIIRYEILGVEK